MTDQPNQGASTPQPQPPQPEQARLPDTEPAPSPSYVSEPPTPAVEPAGQGAIAPATAVARDDGTAGAATSPRRPTALRWAVAIGGVAVVLAVSVAILSLTGARPQGSVALGYMPANVIQYAEYRLDLPGDQRQKLAAFLSAFPGFADQSSIDTKLNEVLDRLVSAVSDGQQTYTRDIQPWFGGQIAMASGPIRAGGLGGGAFSPMVGMGGDPLLVISVTDATKAIEWAKRIAGDGVTETQHSGVTLHTVGGFAFAATDKVLLGGTDGSVRAAIDTKGEGKLADDPEFKAAFGIVERDYVGFTFVDVRGLIDDALQLASSGGGFPNTTVDDELLSMIPGWLASTSRFEDDALVGEGAYPSFQIGFDGKNKRSTLIGHVPPATVAYLESHDIGPALMAILERFRNLPELRAPFVQADQVMGMIGGFDGVFGWWGDVAFAVSRNADGSIGGGLLIQPTDAAAAKRTFDTLRSFIVLGGGQAGVSVRDEQHGDATVTIVDFSQMSGLGDLPPGIKAELAYAVTDDLVAIGYDSNWVKSVLDAGPGPSLADDPRFQDLVKRVGEENLGLTFVDINGIRELVEPLARDAIPADGWALYEREIKPYVVHLDALVSGVRKDGDLDRTPQVITVTK